MRLGSRNVLILFHDLANAVWRMSSADEAWGPNIRQTRESARRCSVLNKSSSRRSRSAWVSMAIGANRVVVLLIIWSLTLKMPLEGFWFTRVSAKL